MKRQAVLIAVVVLALATGIWLVSGQQTCEAHEEGCVPAAEEEKKLSAKEVNEAVENGAMLVDVRTREEYEAGHAPKAINFPVERIQGKMYPTEDRDKPIYVYCRSGRRSGIAYRELKSADYQNVYDIGGLEDWQAIGGELEPDSQPLEP